MNFKYFFYFITLTLLMSTSCSEDDLASEPSSDQSVTNYTDYAKNDNPDNGYDFDQQDIAEAQAEYHESMISFVNSLRSYYVQDQTFLEFKDQLAPVDGLNPTDAGESLLLVAFNAIDQDISDEDIDATPLAIANQLIIDHEISNGAVYLSDIDFDSGSLLLFGVSAEEPLVTNSEDCEWYQLGCHLRNFWEWLGLKPCEECATNGEILAEVAKIVAGFL